MYIVVQGLGKLAFQLELKKFNDCLAIKHKMVTPCSVDQMNTSEQLQKTNSDYIRTDDEVAKSLMENSGDGPSGYGTISIILHDREYRYSRIFMGR